TRICSSAAPLVRRMSRLVGSSTRPTVRVASGSGSPPGVLVGSGDEPVQALRMTALAAIAEMTASRLVRRYMWMRDPLGKVRSCRVSEGDGCQNRRKAAVLFSGRGRGRRPDELGEFVRRGLLHVVGGIDGDH